MVLTRTRAGHPRISAQSSRHLATRSATNARPHERRAPVYDREESSVSHVVDPPPARVRRVRGGAPCRRPARRARRRRPLVVATPPPPAPSRSDGERGERVARRHLPRGHPPTATRRRPTRRGRRRGGERRRRPPQVSGTGGGRGGGRGAGAGAKTASRPGRKGVGPPARRGGKKNKHNNKGAQSAPTLEDAAALAADELSAFDDDDTGDYDPRALARELAAADDDDFDQNDPFEDDEEDDFRVSSSASAEMPEEEDEDDFVFIEDGEEGYFEDEDEGDDGLFLTDADDGLTKKTAGQAKGAQVKSCRYLQSCVRVKDCPPPRFPEIAVIGRSNVGKSSLINMLTNRKEVAKTSKNPGKTQTINHFEMVTGDGTWYLTDLPGYGFANAPEEARRRWALFTREYLLERENLLAVMLLIDSTIKPQRLDLDCLEFLGENDIPVTIVFTKVDKKRKIKAGKRARPEENVEAFCREVSEYWEEMPPMIFTSSKTGDGKQSVLNHVATLRQFFKEGTKGKRM